MNDEPKEEKKIIVDEDWKSQVQAEKEKLSEQPEQEAATAAAEPQADEPLPAPSLSLLVTTLATQAMVALGFITHPALKESGVQLGQAKHFIDMILMLQEKTEGNRTDEESGIMEQILHELRMSYLAIESQQQERG